MQLTDFTQYTGSCFNGEPASCACACPFGLDVRGFADKCAKGRWNAAWKAYKTAVVFPSVVIICIIAGILTNFADIPAVKSAFAAIRVCVCVLIFNAVVKLWKGAVKDKAGLVLFLIVFVLSLFFDISPVVFVLFCALAGLVLTRTGVRGK